jgi:SAM-dependent methyltransferase
MTQHASGAESTLDERNAAFWDELCGSALARQVGLRDSSAESLARFDSVYMARYPYLTEYIPARLDGFDVLEIGLGYGTLSSELIARGASYHGLDIAEGPVAMVRHRMALAGEGDEADERIVQGSALALPYDRASFDRVFTIGCLHHTGDIPAAVREVHRVLRPGGTATVMVYNRNSFRQLVKVKLPSLLRRRSADEVAALYDRNARGDAAPHVEYVSRRQVRAIFSMFAGVEIDVRNFDTTRFIPRERLLGSVDRVLGLDLYITARS